MKHRSTILLPALALAFVACQKQDKAKTTAEPTVEREAVPNDITEDLKAADIPIMPITKGDYWKYRVRVEIPAGVTKPDAAASVIEQAKTRTYLGKVKVSDECPEIQAFDVKVPGEPTERELVEIDDEKIMIRGSMKPDTLDAEPIGWSLRCLSL